MVLENAEAPYYAGLRSASVGQLGGALFLRVERGRSGSSRLLSLWPRQIGEAEAISAQDFEPLLSVTPWERPQPITPVQLATLRSCA